MNTVRYCLVLVLSALAVQPAFAAPGPVTKLVSPSGDVVGTTIAFSWQAVPESTWYLFWLGKGTPTAFIMEQWYSADQAGCASGGGTCTITLTAPVNAGSHVWFIQTWAAGLVGPWSPALQFVVSAPLWSSKLPDARRFTLVLDNEGVLDNETGLVWLRTPRGRTAWSSALSECAYSLAGGRAGWRLPTLSELRSLVDIAQSDPTLPTGHPFVGLYPEPYYWAQNGPADDLSVHYFVELNTGTFTGGSSAATLRTWCVRGGSPGGQ